MALFSSRTKRYQFGKCREPIVFVQAPNGNMLSEKQEVIVTSEHVFWCGAPAKFNPSFFKRTLLILKLMDFFNLSHLRPAFWSFIVFLP